MKVLKDQPVYYHDGRAITQGDIERALKKSGLGSGDIVMVHSDISSFGKLGEIMDKDQFLQSILNCFLNVIGSGGTLLVPTYTYSFCKSAEFDVRNTKSEVGLFSEFVRNKNGTIRSQDPIFSHAGIGRDAKRILSNIGNVCFGENSVFDQLYRLKGKIINFGKYFDITFLHYIENAFQVSYRFDKSFSGTIIGRSGNRSKKTFIFYACYFKNGKKTVSYNMGLLADELKRMGLLKKITLGASHVICSKAEDCYRVGLEMLRKNEFAFLREKPRALASG